MTRSFRLAAAALLTLLATPALAKKPAPADPPAAEASASATATTEAPGQAAAVERLQGTWKIVLNDEQKQELATLQLAFRDPPPTDDELKNLDKKDAMLVGMVLMARKKDPDSQQLAQMKTLMMGLADTTLTFGDGQLTMGLGTMQLGGPYNVVKAAGDKVTIHHEPKDGKAQDIPITFDGDDTIVLSDDKGQETRFQRQP